MHVPVLLDETIEGLNLKPDMSVIDCTIGGGGHAEAFLQVIGKKGRLLGIDQDTSALAQVKEQLQPYLNLTLRHGSFDSLESITEAAGFAQVDAIFFDLGFSSLQLDDPVRGFSFQTDGPLDMRLNPANALTAAALLNGSRERELADIFYRYGDLYDARRLAKIIIEARSKQPIETTLQLVSVLGLKNPGVKAKVFQALRIAVNDELGALERAIPQAVSLLKPGGRLAIITFHSLEDRIVKNAFKTNHLLNVVTKKPVIPSEDEIRQNPRSRSAKLRIAEKELT